jgi:hypothetical protein
MLTKKIANFSDDLLNTVRGILGEEKKCSADCECPKCEAEEMKEGSMPTADEPTDANKKTADKVRAMMAKEKKPVKEEIEDMVNEAADGLADKAKKSGVSLSTLKKVYARGIAAWNSGHRPGTTPQQWAHARVNSYITKGKGTYHGADKDLRSEGTDMPFEKPYKKVADRKDEYGNTVKNVAKHLAKKAMNKQKNEEVEQIDEISADMAHRYLKGKRERDYDISPDGTSSKLKKPQSFAKMNKDVKSSMRALRTIEKAKKANEEAEHTNCGTPECCGQCDTAEQIDELSKATVGRYINKAKDSIDTASYRQGHKEAHGSSSKPLEKKLTKRHKGIETAVKKLTKEEQDFVDSLNDVDMEQIDELSKKTVSSYLDKSEPRLKDYAHPQAIKRHKSAKTARSKLGLPTGSNRGGYGRATTYHTPRVTATEETEITEARGRPRKAGAKDFTIHPKTKERLMHNNPADMARIERLQKNGILEKPKVEAGQHIMNQLRKAKTSMLGGSKINFTHGDSKEVSGTHAAKILTKYAGMRPSEKEAFQKFVGHSHENLMKHV